MEFSISELTFSTISSMRCGMNPPVGDEPFQGNPRHLAADRVEARKDHRLGSVVYDEVDARGGLDGPDVPALSSDDAPLHLFIGQIHHGHGFLGHIIPGVPLDGPRR